MGLTETVNTEDQAIEANAEAPPLFVFSWGVNNFGQLGNGTTINRPAPDAVPSFGDAVGIEAGGTHSLSLVADGTVLVTGRGNSGELGNGALTGSTLPVSVVNLQGPVSLAASVTGDGQHSLALMANATVRAWGSNRFGQLGDGTTIKRLTPISVTNLPGRITAIAAGLGHSLALLANGSVAAWGFNKFGQLGDGTTTDRLVPAIVPGLSNVTQIAAGGGFSLALLADGTVRAWGNNSGGQLGDGTTTPRTTPVQVQNLAPVTAITAGDFYGLAIVGPGLVRAWGGNPHGQLGDGTTINRTTAVAVSGGLDQVTALAASQHSMALRSDGTVRAWGLNFFGQLGNGNTINQTVPVTVQGISGANGNWNEGQSDTRLTHPCLTGFQWT